MTTICIECHSAEYCISHIVMLNVGILSVVMPSIMPSVVILSIILLNAFMLTVVAPISGVNFKINQLLL